MSIDRCWYVGVSIENVQGFGRMPVPIVPVSTKVRQTVDDPVRSAASYDNRATRFFHSYSLGDGREPEIPLADWQWT